MSTSAPAGVPLGSRMVDVTGLRSTGLRERYPACVMLFRVALRLPVLRVALGLPVVLGLAMPLSLPRLLDKGRLFAVRATGAPEHAPGLARGPGGDAA
jgi:hypothetical protein